MNRNNRGGNNKNRNNGNRNNRKGNNGNGNNISSLSFQQLDNEVERNMAERATQIAGPESNNETRRAQEFINETRRYLNSTKAVRNKAERQMKESQGHINDINRILLGYNASPAAVANAAAPMNNAAAAAAPAAEAAAAAAAPAAEAAAAAAAPAAEAAAAPAAPAAAAPILDDEERVDFRQFKSESENTNSAVIKDNIILFIRGYMDAKRKQVALSSSNTDLSLRNLNIRSLRELNGRLLESFSTIPGNIANFNLCMIYLNNIRVNNIRESRPNADLAKLIAKYMLICREKNTQLKNKFNEINANMSSIAAMIKAKRKSTKAKNNGNNGTKNNGTKKNGNNATRRNAKNVGCSGFGCLPWFSGTRKTSKVTPL
jgi:hypothetical protein